MIWSFLKSSLRDLMRHKGFSLIKLLGLAMGIACAVLIILFTKDEWSYDRFHQKGDNIYRIVTDMYNGEGKLEAGGGFTGYFHGPTFAAQIPEIRSVIRYQPAFLDVKHGTEVLRQNAIITDAEFFSVFTFPLLSGTAQTALARPDNVVLTEKTAIKFFGTTDCLGQVIECKEEGAFRTYVVSGIAKDPPANSSLRFGMLLPMQTPADVLTNKDNWFNFFLNTFVLLVPGADAGKVSAKMQELYQKDAQDVIVRMKKDHGSERDLRYLLQPLTDIHLNTWYRAGNGLADANSPRYSFILSGIALFILVIACINFINLTIARSLKRSREIGVRKVVGSSRKQLVLQFMLGAFMLSFFSFVIALGLVQLALPGFNNIANKALSLGYLADPKLIAGSILLWIVTALLAGLYPAWIMSGFDPVETLYNKFRFGGKGYLQRGLVVLQFTLATMLIIGTLTIYRQLNYLMHKPLGYDDKNMLVLAKNGLGADEFVRFRQELMQQAFIEEVAPRNSGQWSTGARVNVDQNIQFAIETVSENYLPLMGVPVLQGRNFSAELSSDTVGSVLVNELFVQKAGWEDPVGQEVNFYWDNNRKMKVIGVVPDYHYSDLLQPVGPMLLQMAQRGQGYSSILVKIKNGTDAQAQKYLAATFRKFFPLEPFEMVYRVDENREAYEQEEKWQRIFLFSTLISIFISSIGLFGLSVLNAERRTKEIGIRKVLGASVAGVV
ncbi:MAG TPA: ABC transporter permease, partial [Phnomibacter sp.]|nr:ABC transporter permease [Phnomibacter sp.]